MASRGNSAISARVSGKTFSSHKSRRRKASIAALLFAAAALSANAYADSTWNGGNGNWSDANWTPTGVPNSTSTNVIINTANSTVDLNSGFTIANLTLGSTDTLSFNLGSTLYVSGSSISNAGQIIINGGNGSNAILQLQSSVNLSGGGTLTLAYTGSGGGAAYIQQGTSGLTLTNSANTIQGAGIIGNGGLSLINQATINANVSGQTLLLNASGGTTNTGLMEATNSGVLQISGNTINNLGGTITANGTGATVQLLGNTVIQGGILSTSNGGTLGTTANQNANLDGATQGSLTILGTYTADLNSTTYLTGTIVNQGNIQLNGGSGYNTILDTNSATVTLQGGGTVTLSTIAAGSGNAIIQQNDGGETLINTNNIIQGEGILGNGGLTLINQSTINANSTGGTNSTILLLNASGGTTNTGLMEATNSGVLQINANTINNLGGTITANGASAIVQLLGNTVIQGGLLSTSNGGTLGTPVNQYANLDGATQGSLTIQGTYTADLNSTTYLVGTFNNKGNIQVNGGSGYNTILDTNSATVTLQGGGTVTLSTITASGGNAIIQQNDGGETLINTNNIIQGEGIIGNGGLTLVNNATIDANSTAGTLSTALLLNASGGITNTSLMEATNSGVLQINATTVNNLGGTITANGASAAVNFSGSAVVQGGTLSTLNGGFMGTTNAGLAYLDGSTAAGPVINKGTYTSTTNTYTYLLGTITNQGTILLQGGNGVSTVLWTNSATVTLQGGGTVTLSTIAASGGNAIIQQNDGGETLNNVNNTIQGDGLIGNGGGLNLINQASGIIDANSAGTPESNALTINLSGGVTNTGLIEATSSGTLQIESTTINNAGGNITANGATASVNLWANATIQGGTLNALNGAFMGTTNASIAYLDGSTQGSLTLNGTYASTLDTYTYLSGTIVNHGTIAVEGGSGYNSDLWTNSATVTLQGGGTVTLSTATGGANAIIAPAVANQILNNINNTIQGAGIIGNGTLVINNQATINANSMGGAQNTALLVDTSGLITNTGLIEATNSGTLQLAAVTINNAGGTITATGANAAVDVYASTVIQGGTINTTGGAFMGTTNASYGYLDGSTHGALTNLGTYVDTSDSYSYISGTIINQGSIVVQGGGGYNTVLWVNPAVPTSTTVTLQGSGTVTLATTAAGGGNAILAQVSSNETLDNVNNTIVGNGIIGNGSLLVINEASGIIKADTTTGQATVLTLNGAGVNNLGTFEASDGATLQVITDVAQDDAATAGTLTGGTYIANVGSTITLSTPALPIVTIGSGAVVVLNGAGSAFSSGTVAIDSSLTTNSGELHIMGGRSYTALAFTNNGLLQLGGFGAATPGNGTFIAPSLVNFGTIEATGMGNVLSIAAGITDPTSPTIQVDAASSLDISGGGSSNATAKLIQNGSLTLGSNSITVSQSYTNANFGVGNSFNKHAGINPASASGTSGAILAAGTPGTSITNQTVAFGHVHVGTPSSLSYTINNTGTGGPAVLFAIQPNANGGTISDAALTGAGITSSNVGPIADGNNSGPLAVNWNPTTGGPVGGATAQTVHIANNFDNIAESNVTITGTAYNLAQPNTISPGTVTLANIHANGTFVNSAISVSNTAPAGAYTEGLDAGPGAPTGDASFAGSITNLSVASSPNTSISVGLGNAVTSTAGLHTGTVRIFLTSNGTVSGLPSTSLTAQTIAVQGTVWNLASPATIPSINFGSVHAGDAPVTLGVTIANGAGAYTEKLDASFGTLTNTSGPASNDFTTNGGSVSLLAPGQSDSTSMTVTFNPVTAGTNVGTVVVHLTSDGQAPGTAGNSGLGTTPLADQTINLNAVATTVTVYRLAQANTLATPINLGNIRVGGSFGTSALSIQNVATNDGFSEGLDAVVAGTTPDATTNNGSITNLLTSDPASTAISVGLGAANTSVAGAKTGTAVISFTSDGATTSGLGLTPLAPQTVTLNGAVYREASTNTITAPINLGIIHVGQSFGTTAVGISNTASNADSYSEGLDAAVTGTTPDATSAGNVTNLAAGATSTLGNQITVGLGTANTSTAGAKTGSVTIGFSTDGATTSGLSAIPLTGPTASQIVTVNGQVNEYAHPAFTKTAGSGTLTNDGVEASSYTLNFPTITEPTSGSATLSLENLLVASDPTFQDSLAGTFTITSGAGTFTLTNFPGTITDGSAIVAGGSLDNLGVSYTDFSAGTYDELLTFTPVSTNAQSDSDLSAVTLDLHLVVNPSNSGPPGVPEPATLGVLALGGMGLLLRKRRNK